MYSIVNLVINFLNSKLNDQKGVPSSESLYKKPQFSHIPENAVFFTLLSQATCLKALSIKIF